MQVRALSLPQVLLVAPRVHEDARGFFVELWQSERYRLRGMPLQFLQDNLAGSKRGTLRGLHLQQPRQQGKLVSVVFGEVFDVAVDVRKGSPHYGHWAAARLSAENRHQLYVPPGHLHGYCALSEVAVVLYKCTDIYSPGQELGIAWDDPDLGIEWPIERPLVSEKDQRLPRLRDVPSANLPQFGAV